MLDSIAAREQRIRLEQFPTHSKQVQWQEFSNDTTQFEKKRNDSLAIAKKKSELKIIYYLAILITLQK